MLAEPDQPLALTIKEQERRKVHRRFRQMRDMRRRLDLRREQRRTETVRVERDRRGDHEEVRRGRVALEQTAG